MGKPVLVYCLLFIAGLGVQAQAPKYSNEFMNLGVGARSMAMANATVASVNDVTAGYWNPAGLNHMEKEWDIGAMHAEYFAGIANYDYLAAAHQLDDGRVLSFSAIRLGVDGIQNTLELVDKDGNFDYSRISKFSVADYGFLFSYASPFPIEGLTYGGTAKIIYRNVGKFAQAWGFGLDAGARYQSGEWKYGLVLRDITSTFNAWSFNESELEVEVLDSVFNRAPDNALELTLPRAIIGISRSFPVKEDFYLSFELNTGITTDGKRHALVSFKPVSIDPGIGAEFSYNNILFARAGINNMQTIPGFRGKQEFSFQPNLGLGIHYKNFKLDYALTDIGDQSIALYSNIFSLQYAFSMSNED